MTTTTIEAPDPAPPQVEVRPVEILLRFVMPIGVARQYFRTIEEILENVRKDYFGECEESEYEIGAVSDPFMMPVREDSER